MLIDTLGKTLTYESVEEVYKKLGYIFFKGNYNLNLFGIRASNVDQSADSFNDILGVVYEVKGEKKIFLAQGTTDPSLTELLNPTFYEAKVSGTAIMREGQYPGLYKLGTHGTGNYHHVALQQIRNVYAYRDNNKDKILNLTAKVSKGLYGLNFHAASLWQDLNKIVGYSAGCQVVRKFSDYKVFIDLWTKQLKAGFGDTFTYTLFNEIDFK